jgi:hypothetical protein
VSESTNRAHCSEQMKRGRAEIEASVIALFAQFVGKATGLRPPIERRLFPIALEPHLSQLVDGLLGMSSMQLTVSDALDSAAKCLEEYDVTECDGDEFARSVQIGYRMMRDQAVEELRSRANLARAPG